MAEVSLVRQGSGEGGTVAAGAVDVDAEPIAVGIAATVVDPVLGAERDEGGGLRPRLLVGDLLALLVGWAPQLLAARDSAKHPLMLAVSTAVAIAATLFCMSGVRLYRSSVCALQSSQAVRVLVSTMLGTVAFGATLWARYPGVAYFPVKDGLMAAIAILAVRWRFARWLTSKRSEGRFLRNVVMIGTNDEAVALWDLLASEPALGYKISAVAGAERPDAPWAGIPTRPSLTGLGALARDTSARGILVVGSALGTEERQSVVNEALNAGLHVQLWAGLAGLASWRVRISPMSDVPMFYVEPHRVAPWQATTKRTIDVTLAGFALLLSAPLVLAAAAMVKLEDGGPVLYRDQRVGRSGAPITVLKLRTMVPNAASLGASLTALNERTGGPLFKASRDPRVTRIGRFLRASSIDELPQLWNVLNGTMSLVGPRPALPSEVEQFDTELLRRHEMRPGITGLWQIEARDNPSFRAYRRLDLAYVDNWSLRFDLAILGATLHAVTLRGGQSVVALLPHHKQPSG
jgi:exopolysaccharide biosynthesis polyprenyl glycosylphosphotransferase